MDTCDPLSKARQFYPEKFTSERNIFKHIKPSAKIFIGTGCGEPQYLVRALTEYVEGNPKALFDAEVYHVWTLGSAPYLDAKFKYNFRHKSFFVSDNSKEAVNSGLADYVPIHLSDIPDLFRRNLLPIDVALIQVSPPDNNGFMTLGISVDITKAAVESAKLVIAQVNNFMPRVHGDAFLKLDQADFIICHDEDVLKFEKKAPDEVVLRIGNYVARIIEDGDTLQVGYGSTPNAILPHLHHKEHLGIHTELLTDGIIELIKAGVIDNSQKTLNPGKTVACFCMGRKETYDYLHDNPSFEFRRMDYTNNRLNIARQRNMVAINSALQIDLTGQSSAESVGTQIYSGVGGHADFMRGALMAPGGKSILTLQSLAPDGKKSRIVPVLDEGTGVTLNRSDVHYVVTEYGIAYLLGKSIRERAMDLIAISHPKFRQWLIDEAKRLGFIYKDQAFIPGKRGEYPVNLERFAISKKGDNIFFRAVKISDEPLLKDFFYSLSDQSLRRRFISSRKEMHHEWLQDFMIIDYTKEMIVVAIMDVEHEEKGKQKIVGIGQYSIVEEKHTAEVAFVVSDQYQNLGIASELLRYLILLGRKMGLIGLTAEVLPENRPMLHLFEKFGFDTHKDIEDDVYHLNISFRDKGMV